MCLTTTQISLKHLISITIVFCNKYLLKTHYSTTNLLMPEIAKNKIFKDDWLFHNNFNVLAIF